MEYKLTEHDLMLAMVAAKERTNTKSSGYANFFGGFHSKDKNPMSDERWFPHMIGLLGEIAYGRTFGEPIDLSFRKGGDKGYDFANKVEVKTRKCKDKNPWLMVRKNDFLRKPANKYVLCRLDPPADDAPFTIVEFLGWIDYEGFKSGGQELEMPGRVNWVIRAECLRPIQDLLCVK